MSDKKKPLAHGHPVCCGVRCDTKFCPACGKPQDQTIAQKLIEYHLKRAASEQSTAERNEHRIEVCGELHPRHKNFILRRDKASQSAAQHTAWAELVRNLTE